MQKDKHNIYSKEEFLKIIKEGKNVPADMDEFDLEALEGLKLLDKPDVLNKLDNEVDKIIITENKKEKQRKAIYYFSAAASLLLLIGLVFLFKNEVVVKNEKVVAVIEKPKEENLQQSVNPPTQAEPQETYEAKEPEEKTKKMIASKESKSLVAQESPSPALADQVAKNNNDAGNQLEEKEVAKKADNSIAEESKAAAPQIKQEQQPVATNETGATSNNTNSGTVDNDRAKKVSSAHTLAAFSNSMVKGDAATATPPAQSDVALQKEKTSELFYANDADKKTDSKNYKEPAFIGGDTAFAGYVKQNLKISSPNNSGIIVVAFLVNKNGAAENIEISRPLNNCKSCSQDIIDLIKFVKKWQPAVENGKVIAAPKKISIQYN